MNNSYGRTIAQDNKGSYAQNNNKPDEKISSSTRFFYSPKITFLSLQKKFETYFLPLKLRFFYPPRIFLH
jgi:hypothetical protein